MTDREVHRLNKTDRTFVRLPTILSPGAIFLAALVAAFKIPFTHPEGDFWDNIQAYLRIGHVVSTFLPGTYPFLTGAIYRLTGARGIIAAQGAIYLLLALSSFLFIRFFLRNDRLAAFGALVVSLDPDLLSSIPKVWDTLPACLALMAFATLTLRLFCKPSRLTLLALAVGWGVSVSIRPNLALLIVPAAFVLWPLGFKRWILAATSFALIGFATYAASNTLAHGSFYIPTNGPYNLFTGANPYAEKSFLYSYNGEPEIDTALHALGIRFGSHRDLWLTPIYKNQALLYIRTHPADWLWLMVIKLLTLLRPDLKAHLPNEGAGVLKVLTSLCVPLWVLVLAFSRRLLGRADLVVIVIMAAYVLPFLLTNSDPRFRTPLDTLALSHAMTLVLRQRAAFQASGFTDRVIPKAS